MQDARSLLFLADAISKENGLTQAEWSRRSGFDEFGKMISNALKRGDCKLSTFIKLLEAIEAKLEITKK